MKRLKGRRRTLPRISISLVLQLLRGQSKSIFWLSEALLDGVLPKCAGFMWSKLTPEKAGNWYLQLKIKSSSRSGSFSKGCFPGLRTKSSVASTTTTLRIAAILAMVSCTLSEEYTDSSKHPVRHHSLGRNPLKEHLSLSPISSTKWYTYQSLLPISGSFWLMISQPGHGAFSSRGTWSSFSSHYAREKLKEKENMFSGKVVERENSLWISSSLEAHSLLITTTTSSARQMKDNSTLRASSSFIQSAIISTEFKQILSEKKLRTSS